MLLTLLTLLAAAVLFVDGRVRSDIVALAALLVLTVAGIISVPEALSGFSNPIVVMMVGLFVVGGAVFRTGLAASISGRLIRLAGNSPTRLYFLVMGVTAAIGAFVSNTGTVALMMPIVVSMCATARTNAARLLMPLAFASSMGGMLTLIGTPPNLVVAELWEETGGRPLGFFGFAPAGLVCLVAGTLILLPLARRFLGRDEAAPDKRAAGKSLSQLVKEYGLTADMHVVEVDRHGAATGRTLGQVDLRSRFDVDVTELRRGGTRHGLLRGVSQESAGPDTLLRAGDLLYVRGNEENVRRMAVACGMTLLSDRVDRADMRFYDVGLAEVVLMPSSSVAGRTVADVGLRRLFGVSVLGLRRGTRVIRDDLADVVLHSGDVLLVQGSWEAIASLGNHPEAWVVLGSPEKRAENVTIDYKAPVAAAIMLLMVLAMVFDFIPVSPVVAVLSAAVLTVLTGCFRNVEAAYRTINWESVVLIAAMMPMSFALEKTGVTALVSRTLVDWLGGAGPMALMGGIYLTTAVLTMFISNTATAVLVAPIAVSSAVAVGASPLPFLMAVTFAASMCFASPFSTPPNALVMPAAQYRFIDYIKVGLPLQLAIGVIMVLVLPLIYPF
ncbi:MAG: SLC13 family permease [Muribaculaceae bacterium]|nr:SLC13 family permease [Muribaculaceae bacterium]